MVEFYLRIASVLLVALLFGGMLFFAAGFAAFLFKHLSAGDARVLIRKAFPPFYLFVILCSALVAVTSFGLDSFVTLWMSVITFTALAARQFLMPAINRATDLGLKKRFVLISQTN